MKEHDIPCSLSHQVLAGYDIVKAEEHNRNESAQLQTTIHRVTPRQDPVKRDHILQIDVQTSDGVEKPRLFGCHLPWVRLAEIVRTRNRKIVLLEPRVARLAGYGVVQQMV